MQFSTLFVLSSAASLSAAMAIPALSSIPGLSLLARQSAVTVSSDTGTASIDVPASTDAGGDVGGKADVAGAAADVASKVIALVQGMVDDDIKRRQAFTQNAAARMRAETGRNVVVSNVGYTIDSSDKTVVGTKYNAKVGSDVTFDIVAFGKGTFQLQGDGGFENWAYVVDGTCTVSGKKITC